MNEVCTRLLDGSHIDELKSYVVDLPSDLEEYYHQLTYSRINKTYRVAKGNGLSETAMVLSIYLFLTSHRTPRDTDWIYIWLIRESVRTGRGIAFHARFGMYKPTNQALSLDTGPRMDLKIAEYLAGCCRDIWEFTFWKIGGLMSLHVKHRTMHDFLRIQRMAQLIQDHVPKHFTASSFPANLHLAALNSMKNWKSCQGNGAFASAMKKAVPSSMIIAMFFGLDGPPGQVQEPGLVEGYEDMFLSLTPWQLENFDRLLPAIPWFLQRFAGCQRTDVTNTITMTIAHDLAILYLQVPPPGTHQKQDHHRIPTYPRRPTVPEEDGQHFPEARGNGGSTTYQTIYDPLWSDILSKLAMGGRD
jgi:hypothetical protein